ncbi:MAG: hypothetical protein QNJ74_15445 [Trichodesmium sp. MO_231.B1]|nr:hypothetical protein [Trichodesmium sp. MO_231.B1]
MQLVLTQLLHPLQVRLIGYFCLLMYLFGAGVGGLSLDSVMHVRTGESYRQVSNYQKVGSSRRFLFMRKLGHLDDFYLEELAKALSIILGLSL